MGRPARIPQPVDRLVYTVEEARSVLRVSRATMYDLMNHGRLKFFKIGNARRIPASEIHRIVEGVSS